MSKKKIELKAAIQAIEVSKPLRLSKGLPVKSFEFKAPESTEIKLSSDQNNLSLNSSQIDSIPDENKLKSDQFQISSNLDEIKPSLNQSEIQSSSDQNEMRSNDTEIKVISDENDLSSKQDPIETIPVQNNPSVERSEIETTPDQFNLGAKQTEIKTTPDRNKLRSKRSQLASSAADHEPQFDVRPFLPPGREVDLLEKKGVLYIPHKLYEFVHKAIETKVEILVFHCLLRNTLGYHRSHCEASQSFIARWTGIAPPNVRKALKSLIAQGLVKRLEEGSIAHDAAVYELPIVRGYLDFERQNPKKPQAKIESSSDRNNLSSIQSENSDQINPRSQINLIPNKERINKQEKKTLSHELPNELKNFFDSQISRKRESEWNLFLSLQEKYSVDEINTALCSVLKSGTLGEGKPIDSPMAYLCQAMAGVLRRVKSKPEIPDWQKDAEKRKAHDEQSLAEIEQERREFIEKEQAFINSFPTEEEQKKFIQEAGKRIPFFKPDNSLCRRDVISMWWDELSQTKGVL